MIEFSMKKILMIGLFIVLFSLLFVMLRTGREMNGNPQIKGDSFIEGLSILQKKDGIAVWTLTARKADLIEGVDKAELSDINMLIQKNGLLLHADKGVYNFSEQGFTTEAVVRAEAKDYTITADSIDYEASSGNIKTGGWIKIEGKRFTVVGKGMKADAGQKVSILNNVKATFYK
ncbi:MAG: LPS export ABC transporter periplasmic protein LptC [Nitrospirae bacterium RBG_13_41_22]|nr:MAG: LPS export ABC transporter periplasmic protein LptC [Nitrospirae bacterium RBG_13_41_22]